MTLLFSALLYTSLFVGRFPHWLGFQEELSNDLVTKWLEKERSQDGEALGLGFNLDNSIKELMLQVPDFSDDGKCLHFLRLPFVSVHLRPDCGSFFV